MKIRPNFAKFGNFGGGRNFGDTEIKNLGHKSLMRRVDKRFYRSGRSGTSYTMHGSSKRDGTFCANGLELVIAKRPPQPILELWLPNLYSETKTVFGTASPTTS